MIFDDLSLLHCYLVIFLFICNYNNSYCLDWWLIHFPQLAHGLHLDLHLKWMQNLEVEQLSCSLEETFQMQIDNSFVKTY